MKDKVASVLKCNFMKLSRGRGNKIPCILDSAQGEVRLWLLSFQIMRFGTGLKRGCVHLTGKRQILALMGIEHRTLFPLLVIILI